ncbi:MAG: hypothetical protein R3C18_12745 [Planctomycetaceae bacterium]
MSAPRIDIIPGRGIGPIELGMNPSQVADALLAIGCDDFDDAGRPTFDCAFSNSLRIEYDPESQKCVSVGIYWHPDCGCECFINDEHLMEYSAEELFTLLAQLDGGDHEYSEQDQYAFPSIAIEIFDLSTMHDYRDEEQRLVYGEIIVGNSQNDDESTMSET